MSCRTWYSLLKPGLQIFLKKVQTHIIIYISLLQMVPQHGGMSASIIRVLIAAIDLNNLVFLLVILEPSCL